jgi:hypothetical protein
VSAVETAPGQWDPANGYVVLFPATFPSQKERDALIGATWREVADAEESVQNLLGMIAGESAARIEGKGTRLTRPEVGLLVLDVGEVRHVAENIVAHCARAEEVLRNELQYNPK